MDLFHKSYSWPTPTPTYTLFSWGTQFRPVGVGVANSSGALQQESMEFKRHHPHQQGIHFNNNYRPGPSNPPLGNNGSHSGYQPGPFVNHHPHPPHNARPFKPNEGHINNSGGRLNLTHSFRNLMKMQGEMVMERGSSFQKLNQFRDLMISRISNLATNLLKDELFEGLFNEAKDAGKVKADCNYDGCTNDALEETLATQECKGRFQGASTGRTIEEIKNRIKGQLDETLNSIKEETRIYAVREDTIMGTVFSKERRVEKDFLEFFNEAERQIIDYEKKFRSDQYGQMVTRLRSAEREMAIRDQKIMHLEDTLKVVGDRSEKYMAELQQVNADNQFEKLQLYHHVEVCKFNAKCMAMEELLRICKWKRCSCGRDYTDLFRELEGNYSLPYHGSLHQDCFPVGGRFKDLPDRREMSCTSSWTFPTGQSQTVQSQPIPTGSFIPSEEAATKGTVLNDLRDRYDELQLKAAVIPNYEEVRTMIMKIVCHFKTGGLRVCEEMRGKQFVSSLFYCNSEDLVPNKTDKVFSTGYGDTPEEATQKSVQRALDEIQRMENMNVANKGMEMTFVRRNPVDSVIGKLEKEAIRMTLLRSYCNENIDEKVASDDVRCLQEAHLYQNHANADEKYMADWKIHIRVEDAQEIGIQEKLKRVLRSIKNNHVSDFVEHRPQKEKAL